jgi:hypothetical protein
MKEGVMAERDTVQTWPLPFADHARLKFNSDAIAVELLPVAEGDQQR